MDVFFALEGESTRLQSLAWQRSSLLALDAELENAINDMQRKKSRIDNPEIVPFALFQLNGAGEFVDVEDIFDRCYQLAPERFGWRKYPYPNYKILSKALRDIEGKDPSLLLKTPDGLKRQLSAKAIQWVRDRLPEFKEILGVSGIN